MSGREGTGCRSQEQSTACVLPTYLVSGGSTACRGRHQGRHETPVLFLWLELQESLGSRELSSKMRTLVLISKDRENSKDPVRSTRERTEGSCPSKGGSGSGDLLQPQPVRFPQAPCCYVLARAFRHLGRMLCTLLNSGHQSAWGRRGLVAAPTHVPRTHCRGLWGWLDLGNHAEAPVTSHFALCGFFPQGYNCLCSWPLSLLPMRLYLGERS